MDFKKKLSLTLAFTMLATPVFAHHNECADFGVIILNNTNSDCLLEHYQLMKGIFVQVDTTSRVLPPHATHFFYLEQSATQGPLLSTTFLCGGKHITFESQQNYCFLQAGAIHGQVTENEPGIGAKSFGNEGSYYYSTPGHINWTINSNY